AWRRLLKPWCDVVGEVSDGRTVIDAAIALEPDVIVLDVSMPGLNGLDACRAIKRAEARTQIVVVTADGNPGLADAAFRAGASAFVVKQSASGDLPEAIRRVLTGATYCTTFRTPS